MEKFIDIHSHILPNIDDGSKNMKQTANMLKIAYLEGIRTIIVTPHYHEEWGTDFFEILEERLQQLKNELGFFSSRMEFYLGSEIYYSHEIIKQLNEMQIPTLAASRFVLVEFSVTEEFQNIKAGLMELLFGGYWPILAHVERYINIIKDMDYFRELVDMGIYLQINAASIIGENGKSSRKLAKKLLKNKLIHFVATDAHSDGKRAPRIRKCARYLSRKYGELYMEEILIHNPKKILMNKSI